jgi:hypothetical protein
MKETETHPKTSVTARKHPNDEMTTITRQTSTRQQFLKWSLSLLAAITMISKPKATALVHAVIAYYDRPSMIPLIEIFFATVALLYSMALGGCGAWAFLSRFQGQGQGQRARTGMYIQSETF